MMGWPGVCGRQTSLLNLILILSLSLRGDYPETASVPGAAAMQQPLHYTRQR